MLYKSCYARESAAALQVYSAFRSDRLVAAAEAAAVRKPVSEEITAAFRQKEIGRKRDRMYKKVNPDLNFVDREHATVKFWKDNYIFEKSIEER